MTLITKAYNIYAIYKRSNLFIILILQIRHRINADGISQVVALFTNIINTMNNLEAVLVRSFSSGSTSTFSKVVNGINRLDETTIGAVQDQLFMQFAAANDKYYSDIHSRISYTVFFLEFAKSKAQVVIDYYGVAGFSAKLKDLIFHLNQSVKDVITAVSVLDEVLNKHDPLLPHRDTIVGPASYKACATLMSLKQFQIMSQHLLSNLSVDGLDGLDDLKILIVNFITTSSKIAECIVGYSTFLVDTQAWLAEIQLEKYDREFPLVDWLAIINKHRSKFQRILTLHIESEKSILSLSGELDQIGSDLIKSVETIVHDVSIRINPLLAFLTAHEASLSDILIKAMSVMTDWQFYLPDLTAITTQARNTFIWKEPYVDTASSEVSAALIL